MERNIQRLWFGLAVLFLTVVSACDLVETDTGMDTADRTLPHTLNVRRVPLDTVRHSIQVPDTVNVDVYVTDLKICLDGANCFLT